MRKLSVKQRKRLAKDEEAEGTGAGSELRPKKKKNSDLLSPNPSDLERGPESVEFGVRPAWDPVPIPLLSAV